MAITMNLELLIDLIISFGLFLSLSTKSRMPVLYSRQFFSVRTLYLILVFIFTS